MEGLKNKFFCFGTDTFRTGLYSDPNNGWDKQMKEVNKTMDRFLQGKELVACQMESICRGNNPPTYGLVVRVSYMDNEEQEE